jgi:ribosome-associated translation inhibitor RaiA
MQTSRKLVPTTIDSNASQSKRKTGPIETRASKGADGAGSAEATQNGAGVFVDTAIHFHGLEKSTAIEDKVRDKIAKLKRHFSRMTTCRVVLDAPNRGSTKAKLLKVKIEVGVPGRKPLVVEHERPVAHAHEDVNLALRDAFIVATRRIDEVAEKLAARVRQERGRRRPSAIPA